MRLIHNLNRTFGEPMKKLSTLAALTVLALTGCNTPNHIEGTMSLSSAINVNANKVFGGTKAVTVPAGTYKTSLSMQQSSASVVIHAQSGNVTFAVPTVAADAMGGINISAAKLGQEFGLAGKIYDTTDGIDRVVPESCIHHYESKQVCGDENCCDRDGKNCHQEYRCHDEQVPVYGSENVHQVGSQSTKNVAISMVKAARAVGRFSGSYTYKENITSSEVVSGCAL
jgi:hypothetical protein